MYAQYASTAVIFYMYMQCFYKLTIVPGKNFTAFSELFLAIKNLPCLVPFAVGTKSTDTGLSGSQIFLSLESSPKPATPVGI